MAADCVDLLTEGLFSLDEPWRRRFLALLAERARGWAQGEQPPTRAQVAAWLDDLDIYLEFSQMLDVWRGVQA